MISRIVSSSAPKLPSVYACYVKTAFYENSCLDYCWEEEKKSLWFRSPEEKREKLFLTYVVESHANDILFLKEGRQKSLAA